MLKLVLPTPEYKEQILSYKEEFLANGDSMDGCAGLDRAESFEAWYEKWKMTLSSETVPNGWVDSTTYLAVDENDVLVGILRSLFERFNKCVLLYAVSCYCGNHCVTASIFF